MIETKIMIEAPISKVRAILFDFPRYQQWNPFILKVQGEAEPKGQIHVDILLPGDSSPSHFDPIVLVKSQTEFRWIGMLGCTCCFTGQHYFILKEEGPNKTELTHGELFAGCLTSLFMCLVQSKTLRGFESMNNALKKRAEGPQQVSANTFISK